MKRSTDRILTTHVGSLPRPKDLVELYRDNCSDNTLFPRLRSAVAEVVQEQARFGIDIVNDGEFGKAMRSAMDFGAWWSYVYPRLAGYELREQEAKKGRGAGPSAARNARSLLNSTPLRRAPPQRRRKAARARRGYTA